MEHGRLAGGVWGLLVGDALGVPYEFTDARRLPPLDQLEMAPPPGWRAAHGVAPGTWSDDGAQALCLLESLLDCERLDLGDLGMRLLRWLDHGHMAVGAHVFDVGNQTRAGLGALRRGVPPDQSGPRGERDNGNGALMRALPLALWHRGSDAELVADAHAQGLPTHGHARSQMCCAVYCLWARGLLHGRADALDRALLDYAALVPAGSPHVQELEGLVKARATLEPRGSGYVLDTLLGAIGCMQQPTYEQVVKAAVALGEDTDTTACVAGGLAGVRDGLDAIPTRWLALMREPTTVEPLVARLLRHHVGP